MPGRIGKSYPRMHSAQPQGAPALRARGYGMLGGLIALFSALGVVGWLLLR